MSRLKVSVAKLRKLNRNGETLANVDISKFCTYHCGGRAKVLLNIKTLENFLQVMDYINDSKIPYFILGNGSNILVSDKGYDGVILKLVGDLARIERVDDTVIECGAGVSFSRLFAYALDNELSGLEMGAGIPASIGGAVYMNAGAYGFETSQIVQYVVAYVDGKLTYINGSDCKFAYRSSVFQKNKSIILRVGISLDKGCKESIRSRFLEVQKKRLESQPLNYGSAGSVFKRIDGINVSKMIDDMGVKGLTVGDAQVSHKHANFIVNLGNAKAQDVYSLIRLVKLKFKETYNIDLTTEIKFLGEFE